MAGADERVRCWAAAQRYRDGLVDAADILRAAVAIYGETTVPVPTMARPVVSVGGSLEDLRSQFSDNLNTIARAREDARACEVPEHVFEMLDLTDPDETLSMFPSSRKQADQKLNTIIELEAAVNEFGDDHYHDRPGGGAMAPGSGIWVFQRQEGGIPEEPVLYGSEEAANGALREFAKENDLKVEQNVGGGLYAGSGGDSEARTWGPTQPAKGATGQGTPT